MNISVLIARTLLLFTTGCFLGIISLSAQSLDSCLGGKTYYISFPDTVRNYQDLRFLVETSDEFLLYLYSPVAQQITIQSVGDAGVRLDLRGGEVTEFNTRELTVPQIIVPDMPQANVLKIEAETPVIVYAYMATMFGCAAFTPLPVEAWGKEYVAATWRGGTVSDVPLLSEDDVVVPLIQVPAPPRIMIIAAYDNTEVTILPTGELAAGVDSLQITLNAGEAYFTEAYVDTSWQSGTQADLAGSRITATKPIGVITGNPRLSHDSLGMNENGLLRNSDKDMAMEWIAPVNQHGTEFVFLPTWDDLHQVPSDNPDILSRDREYVRVYGTTSSSTEITYAESDQNPNLPAVTMPVRDGGYAHQEIRNLQNGRLYRSSEPGQGYQSPASLLWFDSLTGGGNYVGAYFEGSGSYMVEMVPRERWGNFAPFMAPTYPADMNHYLNLVTDTSHQQDVFYRQGSGSPQPFLFNRGRIPGTDLVWGVLPVEPGKTIIVEGGESASFSGFVYGSAKGFESYTPKKVRALSEYWEKTASMYGFPLPALRCAVSEETSHGPERGEEVEEYEITSVGTGTSGNTITLRFRLGESGRTEIALYNALGELVTRIADEQMIAGEHDVRWGGEGIPTGSYHVQIRANGWVSSRKVALVR